GVRARGDWVCVVHGGAARGGAGRGVGLAVGVARPGGAACHARDGDEDRDEGGRCQLFGRLVARGVGSSLGVPR
ncbi:MAG: hypothetical protein CVU56_09325, partial [Deltaproteobacteria bacterium HGW-Deltaproteobacteria-14]